MADYRTDFFKSAAFETHGLILNGQEFISNSPEDTFFLGKQLAAYLSAGCVVALTGTLGSGKTQLTKGIACGLGINENITSPTYTIVNEYLLRSSSVFFHIDAYRLNGEKDFEDIGGSEILNSGTICIIEWSDRICGCLPDDVINISIDITGSDSRRIKISRQGDL